MKTTYKSQIQRLTILVNINGQNKSIDFKWGIVSNGGKNGSIYHSLYENEQLAIEQHKLFKEGLIWKEKTIDEQSNSTKNNRKNKK